LWFSRDRDRRAGIGLFGRESKGDKRLMIAGFMMRGNRLSRVILRLLLRLRILFLSQMRRVILSMMMKKS
jgi:hypothetical protein